METTQEAVMLNRKIVVDVVKKDKTSQDGGDSTETTFEEKAAIVATLIERGIRRVTFGMVTYILMDTYRKIAVAHATKK
jgi:hypothetical protein